MAKNPVGIQAAAPVRANYTIGGQEVNLLRIHGSHDLRRMTRRDELAPWERRREFADDLPLPFRVKMKVDLVDQHDRLTVTQRIVKEWVCL